MYQHHCDLRLDRLYDLAKMFASQQVRMTIDINRQGWAELHYIGIPWYGPDLIEIALLEKYVYQHLDVSMRFSRYDVTNRGMDTHVSILWEPPGIKALMEGEEIHPPIRFPNTKGLFRLIDLMLANSRVKHHLDDEPPWYVSIYWHPGLKELHIDPHFAYKARTRERLWKFLDLDGNRRWVPTHRLKAHFETYIPGPAVSSIVTVQDENENETENYIEIIKEVPVASFRERAAKGPDRKR